MRHPRARPIARPKGMPKIMAMDVPVAIMPSATDACLVLTRRVAMTEAMDQKIAWAQATTMRATTRIANVGATAERA